MTRDPVPAAEEQHRRGTKRPLRASRAVARSSRQLPFAGMRTPCAAIWRENSRTRGIQRAHAIDMGVKAHYTPREIRDIELVARVIDLTNRTTQHLRSDAVASARRTERRESRRPGVILMDRSPPALRTRPPKPCGGWRPPHSRGLRRTCPAGVLGRCRAPSPTGCWQGGPPLVPKRSWD